MSMGGARREMRRLRDALRMEDQTFKAAAPPLDEFGMPEWDGPGVPLEGYERALGSTPDEELTDEEVAARQRLSPYMQVFANLDKPSGGAP